VLTASWPLLPGKAGIANGSSLNDVTEMDCSSSAIDDLIKEVSPHRGCRAAWLEVDRWQAVAQESAAILKFRLQSSVDRPGERCQVSQLMHLSQRWAAAGDEWLVLLICIQVGKTSAGGGGRFTALFPCSAASPWAASAQ